MEDPETEIKPYLRRTMHKELIKNKGKEKEVQFLAKVDLKYR
jgi:hypothetical protein